MTSCGVGINQALKVFLLPVQVIVTQEFIQELRELFPIAMGENELVHFSRQMLVEMRFLVDSVSRINRECRNDVCISTGQAEIKVNLKVTVLKSTIQWRVPVKQTLT